MSLFTHKRLDERTSKNTEDLYERVMKKTKFATEDYCDEQNNVLLEIVAKSWEPNIGKKGIQSILDRLTDKKKPKTSPRSIFLRQNEAFIQRLYQIYVISTEINSVRTKNITQQFYNGMQLLPTLEMFLLSNAVWDPRVVLQSTHYKPLYEFPFMKEMKNRYIAGNSSVITAISNGKILIQNATHSAVYRSELAFEIAEKYHTTNHQVLNKTVKFNDPDWCLMLAHAVAAVFICPVCSKNILYQFSKLHYEQERDAQRWSEKLHVLLSDVNEPLGRKFLVRHVQSSCDNSFIDPSGWTIDSNEDVKEFLDVSSLAMCSFPYDKMFGASPKPYTQEIKMNDTDELYHQDRSLHDDGFADETKEKTNVFNDEDENLYITDISLNTSAGEVTLPTGLIAESSNNTDGKMLNTSTINMDVSMNLDSSTENFSLDSYLDNLKGKKSLVDLKLDQIARLVSNGEMSPTALKLFNDNMTIIQKFIDNTVDEFNDILSNFSKTGKVTVNTYPN